MLDVTYEAVAMEQGRLAKIEEDRGTVRVSLDKDQPLPVVVRQLNVELAQLLTSSFWYQLWGDEIVSKDTPLRSLRVVCYLQRREDECVFIEERKGLVCIFIDPALAVDEFAAAMNPAIVKFLSRGHWFQMFAGEIIDNSAEPMRQA
ncbi:hypothetical protein [Streptomyces sp. cg35]|uniref:hypothetical protein n=1 Tax=Streptomyces sp. cg35 TaxID=3421650 RepID=UPI003D17CAC2